MKIDIPHHLSDEELEAQLKALARGEQEATARLISRLAEFDARRLYLPAGFSSLFNYCCGVLRLSEPPAPSEPPVVSTAAGLPLASRSSAPLPAPARRPIVRPLALRTATRSGSPPPRRPARSYGWPRTSSAPPFRPATLRK